MKAGKLFSLLIFLTSINSNAKSLLTAEEYWIQVKANHLGVKASETSSQAAALKSKEANLLLAPNAFFQTQSLDDKSPKNNTSLMGNKTQQLSSSIGLQKLYSFGLQSKLYYSLSHTKTDGANPMFLPQPEYYDGKFSIELTQPLLRNGLGREVRASIEAAEAQSLASHEMEKFKIKATKAEAEIVYWKLSINKAIVEIHKQSKERAQKIRDWSARRMHLRLTDKSDFLQAEALLKVRSIELQSAEDELTQTTYIFNFLRGIDSTQVTEELEDINSLEIKNLQMPTQLGRREDLEATYQQFRALQAAAKISEEKNSPSLDLYGSMSLNSRDQDRSETLSNSFTTDNSTYVVGIKLTVPLDFELMQNNKSGAFKEATGSEYRFQKKQLDLAKEWDDLARKFEDTKQKYALADELELIQKTKYQNEKERHSAGRSTTFLVLQFEQDYAAAQLQKLKTKFEIISTLVQMNLFGGLK